MTAKKNTFGSRLRACREKRAMTREQLARAADVTASAVYQIEEAGNLPRIDTAQRLAAALQVDIGELVG
jgi:transcriptional regulator with XRE-family HTH domain